MKSESLTFAVSERIRGSSNILKFSLRHAQALKENRAGTKKGGLCRLLCSSAVCLSFVAVWREAGQEIYVLWG